MSVFKSLHDAVTGGNPLYRWLVMLVVAGFVAVVFRGFLRARKIQPNGFKWKTFRNEILFGALNLALGATVLSYLTTTLTRHGLIAFNSAPASGWVIGLEYVAYFFLFDTYFYWFHRLMHIEPIYTWVHKIHHYSVSPNLLTTLSVSPLESLINGGFVPLFTMAMALGSTTMVHTQSMALIGPTNIIMGLYVHMGYEFLPRWWQKTWLTRWFITSTFHDQHHRYFNWNYGGYTTIWDYLCKTARPKYIADFEAIKDRARRPLAPVVANAPADPAAAPPVRAPARAA